MGDDNPRLWTRPVPRFDPRPGQSADHVLWLDDEVSPAGGPRWTYNPDRRAGDVVPEVVKVILSELRPTRLYEQPGTGPKHRAPRRRWPWEPRPNDGGLQMRFAG